MKILAVAAVLSAVFFAASVVFSNWRKYEPRRIESSVLNRKYENEISRIEIQKSGEAAVLTKRGEFWLLSDKFSEPDGRDPGIEKIHFSTCADVKRVNSFICELLKITTMYEVSDRIDKDIFFRFFGESPFVVEFYGKDINMYTKIYIRDTGFSSLYVHGAASASIYEIDDAVSPYITTDLSAWADGAVFPELENAVQATFFYDGRDYVSDSIGADLLLLRHGAVSVQKESGSDPFAVLSVYDGTGRISVLRFFDMSGSGASSSDSCVYSKHVIPSDIDTEQNRAAFQAESCSYEISRWTFDRIVRLFSS